MQVSAKTVFLLAAGIFYLLFPYDFLPDFTPIMGVVDDFSVLLFVYYQLFPANQDFLTEQSSNVEPDTSACQVLGIERNASSSDIKAAYRRLIRLHHPDTLGHLGESERSLACRRMIEIREAYEELNSELSRG